MNAISQPIKSTQHNLFSHSLQRDVAISILFPSGYNSSKTYRMVLVNDGQDFGAMGLEDILNELWAACIIEPVVVVGIHANEDRLWEYGTSVMPDYANRGHRAGRTKDFVSNELLPFLVSNYSVFGRQVVYAGFSLGGLMALDIVWHHPDIFSHAAVFSGALWWRRKALDDGYYDVDRIMHAQIRGSEKKPGLKFWFQCGGLDETYDRDGDGIIDSIQDTLECIAELERKGYLWNKDISYLEMPDGAHNIETWAAAMPEFLIWAFGIPEVKKGKGPAIW